MPANRPCPECRSKGEDSTGDHLYRAMKGSKPLNFFICRKCGYKEFVDGSPVGAGAAKEEAVEGGSTLLPHVPLKLTEADIKLLPSVTDRGIPSVIRKKYGVTTEVSETTGEPIKHFYPITVGGEHKTYKFRDIEKKKRGEKKFAFGRTSKGVTGDTDLFGMLAVRGTPRHIVITEGEEDAMAAQHMLDKKVHNVICLSISDGSDSASKQIARCLEFLGRADHVYYSPDMDSAGMKHIEDIVAVMPSIKIILDLDENDPNDMLLKGKHSEYVTSFMRAKRYTSKFLVEVDDALIDEVCVKPVWGRLYPWETLNKLTYGMRDGEGIFVGAGVKLGKSEWINQLIQSRIEAADGDILAVAKFEEKPRVTIVKLAGKMDGCCYHRPDILFDMDDLRKTAGSMKGQMFLYKAFGTATWDTVKLWIPGAVAGGAKTIIIDPLTKLCNHLSPSDTETELRRISDELACMAQDLGFFYVVTCHLKAPPSGKTPHERGGAVMSNQFRGSRAMMENCYYMLGIERNKDPLLTEDERNTSTFVLLDDRSFGNTGRFPVMYNKETGAYIEPTGFGAPHHK